MAKLTLVEWLRLVFTGRRVRKKRIKKRHAKTSRKHRHHKKIKKVIKSRVRPKKLKPLLPKPRPIHPQLLKVFTLIRRLPRESKRPLPKKLPKELIKEFIASDIMTRNVTTVNTDDMLSYVVRLFGDKQISGAPVLNRSENLVGVISETDIVQFVGSKDLLDAQTNRLDKLKETKVEEIMKRNPVTVSEYTPIHEINDKINKYGITRVIVLDDKRQVIGIITRGDMVRGIAREMLLRIVKPRQVEKSRISTDVDNILDIVERKGTISVDEIKQKLNLPEEKIEEWGQVLEKHNLIEIYYPPVGKPSFRKKVS